MSIEDQIAEFVERLNLTVNKSVKLYYSGIHSTVVGPQEWTVDYFEMLVTTNIEWAWMRYKCQGQAQNKNSFSYYVIKGLNNDLSPTFLSSTRALSFDEAEANIMIEYFTNPNRSVVE